MRFGLFGGARSRGGGPQGDSTGYKRIYRLCMRGRKAGLPQRFHRRASFHRLRPGLRLAQPPELSRGAHRAYPARHGGRGAAVAQSRAGRRAGGDARSPVGRSARFRRRQGLSRLRVRRLLRSARGGDRTLRRGDDGHPQGVDRRGRALLASRRALAFRQCRGRARAGAAAASARSGSAPAARTRSGARRARATICCSTRSARPTSPSPASPRSATNARGSGGLTSRPWWPQPAACRSCATRPSARPRSTSATTC